MPTSQPGSGGSRQKPSGASARSHGGGGNTTPPKGPNYAARRILFVVLALVLLAGIVWGLISIVGWFVNALGGDDGEETPTDAATEISTAQPEACDADGLSWEISPTAGIAGNSVDFRWSVENGTGRNCTIDAAATNVALTVTSGSDLIWSSAHCGSADPRLLLLAPDDATTRWARWGGERSREGCTEVSAGVEPGSYQVTITYAGAAVPGGTAGFELTAPPAEEPPAEEPPAEEEAPAEEAPAQEAPAQEEEEAPPEGENEPAEG
ncbi:MAG TPA: hypothetical protein VFC82_06815 [Actinomycetaceae bacterium]|nr:hypothetical protein [Actinomycetaceae bacterium]